jgi:CHAT domain-containing protein/Flp pilus assembly protein TadD
MKQIYRIAPLLIFLLSTSPVRAENLFQIKPCQEADFNCTNNTSEALISILDSSSLRSQIYSLRESSFKYRQAKNYPQAIELMQKALELAQQIGDLDAEWWARTDLAETYKDSGDLSKALELHQQNQAFFKQNQQHLEKRDYLYQSVVYISKIYTLQKNYSKAIELLKQGLALEEKRDSSASSITKAVILQELGINLFRNGNVAEAESTLLAASTAYENARKAGQGVAEAVGNQYETEIELKRWLQQVLIAQNRTNEALELAEQNRAREFVALLANRLGMSSGFQQGFPQAVNAPNLEQIRQIAKVENSTLVQYTVTYDNNPSFRLTYNNDEASRATNLFIWVIKPTGEITFRRKNLAGEKISLANLVSQARESIGARGRGLGVVGRVEQTPSIEPQHKINYLNQLHQLLIQPIADLLPTDANARVVFIPQDFLFLVPFPALQDANGKYLIETHTLLLSPSIQILDLTRKQQQLIQDSAKGVLIVGNPTMPSLSPEQGMPPQQLPSLPGSEQEANAIAKMFNTQPLIGSQATKAAVLQHLSSARIVHLATHGILDDVFGALSSVALAPTSQDNGFLKAQEIISLKLNAELVVLSACNTGRGKINGDGIIGLSRSFLAAGVPSVIVSQWSVPDAPTALLMTAFYENIKRGTDKAQALRQAMLKTRKIFPNPVNWAAFNLMGEANSSQLLKAATGDVPASTQASVSRYYTVLPVPDNVTNYFELPSGILEGEVDISFKSTLPVAELISFYRKAFQERGLTENTALTHIGKDSFQLVFVNLRNRKKVVIQSNAGESDINSVSVRVEPMRFAP